MWRKALLNMVIVVFVLATANAHDLFLKLDSYFLAPNAKATVRLMNGTFETSEGVVSRERLSDVSIRGANTQVSSVEAVSWRNEESTALMDIQTGGAGTYLVGVSTRPREIDLKAAEFNDYLEHDGLPDTLEQRRKRNELNKDVRERYSKHVRAVFQVGNTLSEDYQKPLGYPVEIIPQQNPYALSVGQSLTVLCTLEGRPLPNQFVIAGWEALPGKTQSMNTRTDANGLAIIKLRGAGKWYVKLIHMTPLSDPKLNYESKWATLTFEVRDLSQRGGRRVLRLRTK